MAARSPESGGQPGSGDRRPVVLALQRFPESVEALLGRGYDVHRLEPTHGNGRPQFPVDPARVRAIATGGVKGASRELMERLPALEIVAVCGVGTDSVDLAYAREHGIRVTITPSVLTDDVADLAMGLLLATARMIGEGERYVRAGKWPTTPPLRLATKVSGRRLGIVGMGNIGRAIARRAEGFGLTISYHSPRPAAGVAHRHEPELVALARESDFLVIAASGGRATRHLVGRAVLDALGPEGILVNVARGSIIDEAELVAALRDRRLGGAGLDVFADEPHVPAALLAMDNVVLSPHRGSATRETRAAMGESMIASLTAHFAGQHPPGTVS